MTVNDELKRCGRKRSWPIYTRICLEGLR